MGGKEGATWVVRGEGRRSPHHTPSLEAVAATQAKGL